MTELLRKASVYVKAVFAVMLQASITLEIYSIGTKGGQMAHRRVRCELQGLFATLLGMLIALPMLDGETEISPKSGVNSVCNVVSPFLLVWSVQDGGYSVCSCGDFGRFRNGDLAYVCGLALGVGPTR